MINIPWLIPPLNKWKIDNMFHFHIKEIRHLSIAMTNKGHTKFIRVEGRDCAELWEELQQKARKYE